MDVLLFPGQGAQQPGMARDLYDTFPDARARLEQADEILGFSLTDLMFGIGSPPQDAAEKLRATEVTQPALYVHSMAAWTVAQPKLQPALVAGHSLGEYSALAAAGAISFADGLRLVRMRGEQMAAAGLAQPGTMAAIMGAEDAQVEALCEAASQPDSPVVAANYNAPGQVVISGHEDAVARAIALAPEYGARKAVALAVSGAFHSPLMASAREGLAAALTAVRIEKPVCPVFLNVTATPTQDPEEIRARLLEQLTAPVRWTQSVAAMHAAGGIRFIEIGTGNVLSGLTRRALGRMTPVVTLGTASELRDFLDL
jgi:[acyl-carrier-protein] S-malonyltransferase